jgi:hypothetical protein
MMPQDCPDYSQADANQLAAEGDAWLAAKYRNAIQTIRDFTQDCGIDRLMDIRRIADEALMMRHDRLNFDADPENDPNFGDYNIPPGGSHP